MGNIWVVIFLRIWKGDVKINSLLCPAHFILITKIIMLFVEAGTEELLHYCMFLFLCTVVSPVSTVDWMHL